MRYVFLFCVSLIIVANSVAQQKTNKGKDFWMTFIDHVDDGTTGTLASCQILITSTIGATVHVYMPKQNFNTVVVVPANGVVQVPITDVAGVFPTSEGLFNKAIHIVSDNDIVVYAHQYFTNRAEASLILPNQSLGNEYFAMTYAVYASWPSEFAVVAIEDQTIIDITPRVNTLGGRPAGVTFSVTIDSGEIYQVQSTSDLTGSYLKSTKNFALFAGNAWAGVPSTVGLYDNLYEQIFPITAFGTKYALAPFESKDRTYPLPYFDRYRVLASVDNTDIYVDGAFVININKGQYYEGSIYSPIIIETSQPTLIGQFMSGANITPLGDPSMVILNPVGLSLDTAIFYASPLQLILNNYVSIYCFTADTGSITLDGSAGLGFSVFPADTLLAYARLDVANGAHTIISSGCNGFQAIAYGLGYAESYAYAAGVNLVKDLDIGIFNFNTAALPNSGCVLDTFKYNAFSSDSIISLIWDFGDPASGTNDTSTSTSPQHIYLDTGDYVVTVFAEIWRNCLVDTIVDTQSLSIGIIDTSYFIAPDTICENTPIQFIDSTKSFHSNIIQYDWDFNDGFTDTAKNPIHAYNSSGDYVVTLDVLSDHGCVDNSSFPINVIPPPAFTAFGDTVVCTNIVSVIGNNPQAGQTYLWSPDLGLSDTAVANPTLNLQSPNSSEIDYVVYVLNTASGCFLYDTVKINFHGALTLNDGIDSIGIISRECTTIVVTNYGTPPYNWTPNDFTNLISTNTIEVCPEETYTYVVTDSNGCSSSIIIKTIKLFEIYVPSAFTPNKDNNNDVLSLIDFGIDELIYFKIFDRWGQLVFSTKDLNQGWNGTRNGKEQSSGMYIYEIEAITLEGEKINRAGQIALIR